MILQTSADTLIHKYKKLISNCLYTKPEHIFLFWKGRVALYAALKAIGIKEGDEVILPAFTCVVVPSAVIYLGAKPIYVDINKASYEIDIAAIEEKITSRTKCLILQNTFGNAAPIDELMAIAEKHNLKTIEDCAHGFGGSYKNKANGTFTDIAFFSTQWNKFFSTGLGGIAVVNNPKYLSAFQEYETLAMLPKKSESQSLAIQIQLRKHLLNEHTYYIAQNIYRRMSALNLITGSSQGEELKQPKMPKSFLKGMSSTQVKAGIRALQDFDRLKAHRRKIGLLYHDFFIKNNLHGAFESPDKENNYLLYPFLVKDKSRFLKKASQHKIRLGDWFSSPLHPITQNLAAWHFKPSDFPNAHYISTHILNLPTGFEISVEKAKRIISFLQKNQNELIRK